MPKKLILCLLSIVLVFTQLSGQVMISAQIPAAGLVQRDQLWNLSLLSAFSEERLVELRVQLQNAGSGEVVMSAVSGSFTLKKGVQVFNASMVQPVIYNNYSVDNSGTYLKIGNYLACYQIFQHTNKGDELLGDECVRLVVEPLSPPLLVDPVNLSILSTESPMLSWLPPMPVELFPSLNYEVAISEILDGQTAADAISQNIPVISYHSLKSNVLALPPSLNQLQLNHRYAWQVTAKNANDYSSQSEIWQFKLERSAPEPEAVKMTPYVKLKTNQLERTLAPDGILKFSYSNRLNDSIVDFEIVDLSVGSVAEGKRNYNTKLPLSTGENLKKIKLKGLIPLDEKHVYKAILTDSQKERWIVIFQIKNY